MKTFNRESGKIYSKRTSASLGVNQNTTGFQEPFYAAQALANCALPQPPLTYKMNPNLLQSDYLSESYQQNSTQTDLVIKECLAQPDQPKQSSVVHQNRFIQRNDFQVGQLSSISLQHSSSGQPPSSGLPSDFSGYTEPFYAAPALANCALPQPPLTYKMNPNLLQSDYLSESYQQNSTQTDLVIKECLTQPDQPKQSSVVHQNRFIQRNDFQVGQLSSISLQHSSSGQPPSSGLPSDFSGYTEPFYAAPALANCALPQPPLTYKMNPNLLQSDYLSESYQQNSTQTDLVIKECLTQPDQPKQSSVVHQNRFIQRNDFQVGQLSSISLQHSSSGQPPSSGLPSDFSGYTEPFYAAPALANCALPQPPLTYKMNPNLLQSDYLSESYQQNSTQTDLVIKECLTQPDQPKQSSVVHQNRFIQRNDFQVGQLSSISLQHSSSGQPPSSGLPSDFSGYTEPFYAAPALANCALPQPPLTYKMNPNLLQSDYLSESYQQNSTQTDLVIKECLTQPDQPKQSSVVHQNRFIQRNDFQVGQLSSISRQKPSSGQPPPYQPGGYQLYYGPYYGAPPSAYHYSAQAPVPSSAAVSRDEFADRKKTHGVETRLGLDHEVGSRRPVQTSLALQRGVAATHGVRITTTGGNDYNVKDIKDSHHKTDDMAPIKTRVPDILDNPSSNLADSAASLGNKPLLKKYDFREASRDLIRQLTFSEVRKHVFDNKRGTTFGSVMHIMESSKQIDMTVHGHFFVDLIIELLNSDEFRHVHNWIQVMNQEERFLREKERRRQKQAEINVSSGMHSHDKGSQQNAESGEKRKYSGHHSTSKKYRHY